MIDFPNDPLEDDVFLDNNGRFWLFKNGYWQESIQPFSIDLLRDVQTVYDLDTISFVDYQGTVSSITAEQDLPLILADNSVDNIPFEAYGLPFYNSDSEYDVIDIIKYEPELNSLLYWDGSNWFPFLREYTTKDVDGFNTDTAVSADVMVYDTGEFVPKERTSYIQYQKPYSTGYLSEIETTGYQTITDYETWYDQRFDDITISTDTNMVDLANNRLICTRQGIYKISFFSRERNDEVKDWSTNYYWHVQNITCEVHDSIDTLKYEYKKGMELRSMLWYYDPPFIWSVLVMDTVQLEVGDYMTFKHQRRKPYVSGYLFAHDSPMYGKMSMHKIG